MSDDGFATFISDDLPGFDSLSGSGFFDQAGDWEQSSDEEDGSQSSDLAEGDDGFGAVRTPASTTMISSSKKQNDANVFFFESEDDGEDDDDHTFDAFGSKHKSSALTAAAAAATPISSSSKGSRQPGRHRRPAEAPGAPRTRRSPTSADGKKRIRRVRSDAAAGADDKSVGSRQSVRRHRRSEGSNTMKEESMKDGSSMSNSRPRRTAGSGSRRSDNLKKKGLDLGSRLDKLTEHKAKAKAPMSAASVGGGESRRRLGRRESTREMDDTSVGAGSVQSSASNMGRRGDRRRRATQSHDLLARNLQHYGDTPYQRTATMDDSLLGRTNDSNADAVWKQRRRRNENTNAMPAIAA